MLKQLMLARRKAEKEKALEQLREAREELRKKREALKKREEELEQAVQEITEETEEEAKTAVEEAVADFESEVAQIEKEETENAQAITDLEEAISDLQEELDEIAQKVTDAAQQVQEAAPSEPAPEEPIETNKERNVRYPMKRNMKSFDTRAYFGGDTQRRAAFFARDDVKQFAQRMRTFIAEKRAVTGGDLLIPQVMLPMIREVVEAKSKLVPYVNVEHLKGTSKQPIMGAIPEAVWTDMYGRINEMSLNFASAEMDGHKVAAFIPMYNSLLEDSDEALAEKCIFALGVGIAKALDKAILYGTGTRMPLGIVTRLAQTSQPADYPATARPWEDLHTSNIIKISVANSTGITLFQKLAEAFGNASDDYGDEGEVWVMNKKTRMKLIVEAMNFNANGAIVAGLENTMPVIGGDIVVVKDVPDNIIVAGYGCVYSLAERAGTAIDTSKDVLFLDDQTVFRGKARYDGKPVIAEGFVAIGISNTDVDATAVTFDPDKANSVESIAVNTATAKVTVGGTLQLHAYTKPGKGTVTWASATTGKATVDEATGVVTGVSTGSSVITATCDGKTAQCTVTVEAAAG